GPMMCCLATFHLGGTNVFLPNFDAREACRLIERERCRGAFLFGPMIEAVVEANKAGEYDLSSLHAAGGGAEWNRMITVSDSPWDRAFAGYGQTEVGGMLTIAGYGKGGTGTHGRPSPLV